MCECNVYMFYVAKVCHQSVGDHRAHPQNKCIQNSTASAINNKSVPLSQWPVLHPLTSYNLKLQAYFTHSCEHTNYLPLATKLY